MCYEQLIIKKIREICFLGFFLLAVSYQLSAVSVESQSQKSVFLVLSSNNIYFRFDFNAEFFFDAVLDFLHEV